MKMSLKNSSRRTNLATTVVNLRKEPYDVYIGRAGKGQGGYFGNPFTLMGSSDQERHMVLVQYRLWFEVKIKTDPEFKQRIQSLKGKRLGCFCKPKACHGDVIAEYLNKED